MINKIYNLIIYAHFVKLCISNHIKYDTRDHLSKWLLDHNDVLSFQRKYLQEKVNKYLGDIEFDEIDHNRITQVGFRDDIFVVDIECLITSLSLTKVSDRSNLSPEKTDDSFCKGWVVDRFKVMGCDHETTKDIEEYIENSQDRIVVLIRDCKIQEIVNV